MSFQTDSLRTVTLENIENKNITSENKNNKNRKYKGLYISNDDMYYIVGTNDSFKSKLQGSILLEDGLTCLYNQFSVNLYNNKFMIQFYKKCIRGDVIIYKKNGTCDKNTDDFIHLSGVIKTDVKKCDQCGDFLIRYHVGKLIKGQCEIHECLTNAEIGHEHILCPYCITFGKGRSLTEIDTLISARKINHETEMVR
jgi:hypothetical protein